MRDTEHFLNHLAIETAVDGETIRVVQVQDPFHTTTFEIKMTVLEWVKFFFKRQISIRVNVRADRCAIRRWFDGIDVCERCGGPELTGHPTKPGYESRGQRICEACYYEHPIPKLTKGLCQGEANG